MDDREQQQRERAYKIWEDEGRLDGSDADHWQRAEKQHEATEKAADAEVTETNIEASEKFNGKATKKKAATD